MSAVSILLLMAGGTGQISAPPRITPRIPVPSTTAPTPQMPSNLVARAISRGIKLSYTCTVKTTKPAQSSGAAPTVENSVATITLAPRQTDTAPGATPVTYDPIKVKGVIMMADTDLYVFGAVRPDGFSSITSPPKPGVPSGGFVDPVAGLSNFANDQGKALTRKYAWSDPPAMNLNTGEIRWAYRETATFQLFQARGQCA